MKFKLEIDLGKDNMRTMHHVAEALADVRRRLIKLGYRADGTSTEAIMDVDGNDVGRWEFTE